MTPAIITGSGLGSTARWRPREVPVLVKELEEEEFLVKKLGEAAAAASSILWARVSLREEISRGVTPGASSPGARS